MPFLKRFLLFIFLIGVLPAGLFSQQKQPILTRKYSSEQLKKDATLFRDVTLAMHPAVGLYEPRTYYEKLFNTYISSLNDSLTEKEFRIKSKLVAEELHCGHTEVIYSQEYYRAMNKQRLNFSPYVFIPVQNKVYVIANLNKKADTTLKRGMEITRINGIAVDSMLRHCRRFISADGFNVTAKNHYVQLGFNAYYTSLFGRPDTFSVEYKDGKTLKNLRYAAFKPKAFPPIPLGPRDDSLFTRYRRAKMQFRYLDPEKKTGILKLQKFSRKGVNRVYRKIFRRMKKNKSDNLVIDLRNNGGGSLENCYKLLGYLLDTAQPQTLRTSIKNYPYKKYTNGNILFKFTRLAFYVIGKKTSRNDTDYFTYTIKKRKKNHFNGKIYVLINGGSFSASCLVAAYLKDRQRATFIGEETGGAIEGCNAGITPYYKLPSTKIKVRMPAFRIIHDVSPQLTGYGVQPDYKTEYTIKDILNKRDLELIKVKELVSKSQR